MLCTSRAARAGLFLLLVVLIPAYSFATPLLEIQVPDRDTWQRLASGGFDIIDGPRGLEDGVAYVVGWPQDLVKLQQRSFSYSVFIEDMEAWNAARLDSQLDDMGGYPTFSEMETWLDQFADSYPSLVSTPEIIGFTYENRPIRAYKISDNPNQDEDEPEIFINMLIHAREVVTLLVAQEFSEYLAMNYWTDQRVMDLVDNNELWFVPVMNPDGLIENENIAPNGGGMHRKNMSPPDGVDLNRNWPYLWGLDDEGSSPFQYDQTYRGPSPGSEPETQAYMDFINAHEFEAVLNYHTYSNYILIPWAYTYDPHPQRPLYMAWGNYLAETLGNDWLVGSVDVLNYLVNGDAQSWQVAGDPDEPTSADYPMYSFVFEVGSWSQGGFWPDINTGNQLAAEQIEPLMRFCETAPNPTMIMPPVPPVMTVGAQEPNPVTVTWTHDDPNGNDAVSYDLAELNNAIAVDGAEDGTIIGWNFDGFTRSTAREHAGAYSYYSGEGNNFYHSMDAEFPIHVESGTDFTFWTWYDIESDYDYAYVMASVDGEPFTPIEGNITTQNDPNGVNMGHGITGTSGGWVQGIFDLEDYLGSTVRIRFAYITDTWVTEEGIYVDDITPVSAFETMTTVATDITQQSYTIDYGAADYPFTTYYTARATDAQDQTGGWAQPAEVEVTDGGQPNAIFELTGINTTVGPTGGTVTYSASLQTFIGQSFQNVNYWTMVTLPNGNDYGPVSQISVNVPAFADITVPQMQLGVPAFAPTGVYTFTGNLGYYPNAVLNDSFGFEKTAASANQQAAVSEWSASDWPAVFMADAEETAVALPSEFELSEARPNPFNPETSLTLSLPQAVEVSVVVYDVQGRVAARLASGMLSGGVHTLTFDGTGHASGVYFVRASSSAFGPQIQKMVLLK